MSRTPKRNLSASEQIEILQRARELREQEWGWSTIAREFDIGEDWLKRRLLPGYAESQNQSFRAYYGRPRRAPKRNSRAARITREELRGRVPEDTRDITGRHFGDPLPGRSALDRRQA